ncbi:helix-turn-helix transcriptional regulator [Ruegeria arenilitoris]|uniref:helix-turn-helix transcriptional regulator n=1 Tax=Ruegeria arenilitoris TaxID=1173585 RepID=UPI00147C97A6|nr:AlpA family phage regulatory protein [Ruegeria arenilitoris]
MQQDTTPWQNVQPTGRLLRPAEVVEKIGLSRSQIYQMISEGRFPPFIKLSDRASAMPESWLSAFVESCAKVSIGQGYKQ